MVPCEATPCRTLSWAACAEGGDSLFNYCIDKFVDFMLPCLLFFGEGSDYEDSLEGC